MRLDPSLYLFDGSNLFHAGPFRDREELTDLLASFVAVRGARGVIVFDGHGEERRIGPLTVLYAAHADAVLERLAAEHRDREASSSRLGDRLDAETRARLERLRRGEPS